MSGQRISRPMLGLLIATVLLTVASYGVRQWRESAALPDVIEGAEPARLTDGASTGNEPQNPAVRADLLRPIWPTASIDAMASKRPVPPPNAPANEVAAPPPAPVLPPPSFRLIGRHVEGKRQTLFFVQGEEVFKARVGQQLPDGFVLKAARGDKVTVVRKADGQQFDMSLEAP